ncbi:hypothetical protein ACFPM7_28090 [Actinokineospora guangxiensis]|uniref:Uncharacterized protein n=1 Tax=Actinokineospora guangxiensis TaxID=1490288 RepID=A0ABW0EWS6_9PSEU
MSVDVTTLWQRLAVEAKVVEILEAVPCIAPVPHQLGRPYLTAYQIAIRLDERHPEVAHELGVEIGGRGVGRNFSLASYLGRQLSELVRRDQDGTHPIEGAFLSSQSVTALTYIDAKGNSVESSATGTPYDLSLFRRRQADR